MAEVAAVAAGARTGSSAGLAKSLSRGIGRRLSWSSNILRSGLDRPTSGHRRPFPSHPLGDFEDEPAEDGDTDAPEKHDRDHSLLLLFTWCVRP